MATEMFYGVVLDDKELSRLELDLVTFAKELYPDILAPRNELDSDEEYQEILDDVEIGDVIDELDENEFQSVMSMCRPAMDDILIRRNLPTTARVIMVTNIYYDQSSVSEGDFLAGFRAEDIVKAAAGLDPAIPMINPNNRGDLEWLHWENYE